MEPGTIWIFISFLAILKKIFLPFQVPAEMALGWWLSFFLLAVTILTCIVYLLMMDNQDEQDETLFTDTNDDVMPPVATSRNERIEHSLEQERSTNESDTGPNSSTSGVGSSLDLDLSLDVGSSFDAGSSYYAGSSFYEKSSRSSRLSITHKVTDSNICRTPAEEPKLDLQKLDADDGWTPTSFDWSIHAIRKERRQYLDDDHRKRLDNVRKVLFPAFPLDLAEPDEVLECIPQLFKEYNNKLALDTKHEVPEGLRLNLSN